MTSPAVEEGDGKCCTGNTKTVRCVCQWRGMFTGLEKNITPAISTGEEEEEGGGEGEGGVLTLTAFRNQCARTQPLRHRFHKYYVRARARTGI